MNALLLAVFVASLLGSLHCAGMCGPFVAFATLRPNRGSHQSRGSAVLQSAYHGGRLLSYVSLGLVAGQLGSTLNLGSSLLGIGKVAGVLAGVTLVTIGLGRIVALVGVRLPKLVRTAWLVAWIGKWQAAASQLTPPKRALVIGLLSAVIPCGWLYAFVAVAAGTGLPFYGALVMLAFWIGTVPVLAGIGAGLGAFLFQARRPIQVATAVVVVFLGLGSIGGRWQLSPTRISPPTSTLHAAQARVSTILGGGQPRCH